MGNICRIQWLGCLNYGRAVKFQQRLVAKRAANQIPNTLLLLEHPPTYSVGLGSREELLLINRAELSQMNIAYYEADRSGSVIYHGPGQLAVYPIMNLQDFGYNFHSYVEALEGVIMRVLRVFKIHAFRQPGQRGIWVLPRHEPYFAPRWVETEDNIARVGLIGARVNNAQITSFGFYLNVAPDLSYFDFIMPRGLESRKVTSLYQVLNRDIEIGDVLAPVIQSFCELFQLEPMSKNLELLSTVNQAKTTFATTYRQQ